jgi:CRISPR system Cascade subunit CasB
MPTSTDALVLAERRWAAFFNAAALVAGPNTRGGVQLGQALYEAGFSELRFVRLLRANGDALFHEIRGAARFLAAKGQSVDIYGFARLLFSDTTVGREAVRRDIARTYYQYAESKTKEN